MSPLHIAMLTLLASASANIHKVSLESFLSRGSGKTQYDRPMDESDGSNDFGNITKRDSLVKRVFNPTQPPQPGPNPRDCGILTFDCNEAWDACNNACFHQFCVLNDADHYYQDLGPKSLPDTSDYNDWNRVRSGQETDNGKLCRNLPLSQRFYDKHNNWQQLTGAQRELEPDEWPMAAMIQPDFDENSVKTLPRNSLRCAEKLPNGRAGSQYSNSINGHGRWGKPTAKNRMNPLYVGNGPGKDRDCTNPNRLQRGDKFRVRFDPNGMSMADQQKYIPYCLPNPSCENDGFQFHLSALHQVPGGTHANSDGNMRWPYDPAKMNEYALTNAKSVQWNRDNPNLPERYQPESLQMFKVVVTRSGTGGEKFDAWVSYMYDGGEVQINKRSSNQVAIGGFLEFGSSAQLPQKLRVTRLSSPAQGLTCPLGFQYGQSGGDDPNRWFAWTTGDIGAATRSNYVGDGERRTFNVNGQYCEHSNGQLPNNGGPTITWTCWFAGY